MFHIIPIAQGGQEDLGRFLRQSGRNNTECFILEKDGVPVAGIIDLEDDADIVRIPKAKVSME